MYYIRKDYKRAFNFIIGIYVNVTGASELPNGYIVGVMATLLIYCLFKCLKSLT